MSSRIEFRTGCRVIHEASGNIRGCVQLSFCQFRTFFDAVRICPGDDRGGLVYGYLNRFLCCCVSSRIIRREVRGQCVSPRIQFRAGCRSIHKSARNICGRVQLGRAQGRAISNSFRGCPGDDRSDRFGVFCHNDFHRFLRGIIVGGICRCEVRGQCLSAGGQFCAGCRSIHKGARNVRRSVQLSFRQFCAFFDTGRSCPGDDWCGLVHFQQDFFLNG